MKNKILCKWCDFNFSNEIFLLIFEMIFNQISNLPFQFDSKKMSDGELSNQVYNQFRQTLEEALDNNKPTLEAGIKFTPET